MRSQDLGVALAPGARTIEELYRLTMPTAIRTAYLITGDRNQAEDIAQDAFLKAASGLTRMRDADRFTAYLRTTVLREVLQERRRAQRAVLREQRTAMTEAVPAADADVHRRVDLASALASLPVRQRTALVLRYWLDCSEAEMADLLRCRRGTVKSLLARGIAAMKEQLDHDIFA